MPEIRDENKPLTALPFPPLTTTHILNCSYHIWHPLFRSLTPKARLVPLPDSFISYLREDGIVLPPSAAATPTGSDSGFEDDEDEHLDPSANWAGTHATIAETIAELGGKVYPKLNWSAPKDATWMSTGNDMECRTPNDIYLLLKSSDFITHDLEHAFEGCMDRENASPIPYHLALRKSFNLNPSLEFRCFVRNRRLIGISQREMNFFEFLFDLRKTFHRNIEDFFEEKLREKFPENNYVFDVYIPPPHERVWLIDINPWAPRTDPLLFSWLELLSMEVPEQSESDGESGSQEEVVWTPEFRLVQRDDPEAYQFAATKYSAHKLPKEVVDAGSEVGGMREMMEEWKKVLDKQVEEDSDDDEMQGAPAS